MNISSYSFCKVWLVLVVKRWLRADVRHTIELLQDKKRCIQELLVRLRDKCASRLEAAATNRDTLRSQTFRIWETIELALNADTTLTEHLRTLFREQGVIVASILTAFGFIMSTTVLAIQTGNGGVTPAPAPPTPGYEGTDTDWVKKTTQDSRRFRRKHWPEGRPRRSLELLVPSSCGSSRLRARLLFGLRNTCGQRFSLWSPRLRFVIARCSKLWHNLLPRW